AEFCDLRFGSSVLHILDVLQIVPQQLRAETRFSATRLDKLVESGFEQRTVLPNGPRDLAATAHRHARMQPDLREDLLPEVCLVVVHHDDLHKPCIQHLEQVFVFQFLRRSFEDDLRFALLLKLLVRPSILVCSCEVTLMGSSGIAYLETAGTENFVMQRAVVVFVSPPLYTDG